MINYCRKFKRKIKRRKTKSIDTKIPAELHSNSEGIK